MVIVTYDRMLDVFRQILVKEGLSEDIATKCATILADNTLDGVPSHGVDRFEQFVDKIKNGQMNKDAVPIRISALAGFEQWDGNSGIGPIIALQMIDRAMELADEHGVGVVALRNTTHWMRGATYGYRAVSRGYACICWTNTMANMTVWQTATETIGNNPIVLGIPGKDSQVVLDMALSQYSYGKLTTMINNGQQLEYYGGFDSEGNLTKDPEKIKKSRRVLPIGLWKGSGLSIVGDLFVSALSHGTSTVDMPSQGSRVSQFFLAINPGHSEQEREYRRAYVDHVLQEIKRNCELNGDNAFYPGEGTALRRARNKANGISVHETIWESILKRLEG